MMLSKSIALDYAADGLRCNLRFAPASPDTPMFASTWTSSPTRRPRSPARLKRVPHVRLR